MESRRGVIIGRQLRRARELLDLEPDEVAEKVSVSPQAIGSWEEELAKPSLNQLERLANLYGRAIDYFLRETPMPPQGIEFRGGGPGQSLKGLPEKARIVLARFDELCRTALEFENLLSKPTVVKLPRFEPSEPPRVVAQTLRERFGVVDNPLRDLRERLEGEGLRVFELLVPDDAFSGFSYWHSDYGPSVLVNGGELKGRRLFTLAHELAHLLYEHGSSLCYIPPEIGKPSHRLESKANRIAIELLLPQSGVRRDFRKRGLGMAPSQDDMSKMTGKWGVSLQALGYRLENLHLIKSGYTDTLWESKPQYFKRATTPAWERQLGKKFVEMSIEAYKRDLISVGTLAHALQLPVRKALERAERGGP